MYNKVETNMNFVDREKQTEKFWEDHDIFKKSMEQRKQGETYTFYDGPPTANGKPHIGHVLTRVIKDMIPRYQTMKGKYVPRKAGWDTHGLPVELEVEKMLGLNGKEQIEEYGMEPFIKKCKESVWKYKGMWEDFSGTVGFWADLGQGIVIQRLQDRSLLPSLWYTTFFAGSCAGLQDRERAFRSGTFQSCRRGCLFPRMDHNSVDTSIQRCTLCEPG